MKMKTSELSGATLDWVVANIELTGHDDYTNVLMVTVGDDNDWKYNPSTNWMQGGPIIERERLQLSPGLAHDEHGWSAVRYDHLFDDDLDCFMGGDTPLIAAMRCYVASKLGDEVEVPEELSSCKYCGGNCMLDNDHACDGYLGDIDKLYAND